MLKHFLFSYSDVLNCLSPAAFCRASENLNPPQPRCHSMNMRFSHSSFVCPLSVPLESVLLGFWQRLGRIRTGKGGNGQGPVARQEQVTKGTKDNGPRTNLS